MADEALKTLLCLPGKHRNYAVEFPYAEEICLTSASSPPDAEPS